MKKLVVGTGVIACVMGLSVSAVLAYHCPALVQACNALVAKMEKNARADQQVVMEAKKKCEEAATLHDTDQHADSVITAGEAIALAGKAAK